MADKTNPLDSFAGSAKNGENSVKLREFPKLSDFVSEHGFKEGIAKYDTAMEEARQHHERTINELLQSRAPISDSKLQ